jgi:hypothetical protein
VLDRIIPNTLFVTFNDFISLNKCFHRSMDTRRAYRQQRLDRSFHVSYSDRIYIYKRLQATHARRLR